jgi:hypothetical protein
VAVALVVSQGVAAQTTDNKPVTRVPTAAATKPATKPVTTSTQKASPSAPAETAAKPVAKKPAARPSQPKKTTTPGVKPATPPKGTDATKAAAVPKTTTTPKTTAAAPKPSAPSTPPPTPRPVASPPPPPPVAPAQQATALTPPTTSSAALSGGAVGAQGGSFATRHPVLSGFVAGLGGAWLADKLLGPPEQIPAVEAEAAGSPGAETAGLATRLALLGGLGYLVFTGVRWRQSPPRRAASGQGRSVPEVSEWSGPLDDEPRLGLDDAPGEALAVGDEALSVADEQDFADIVTAVQLAWGSGHVVEMRGYLSPEMADYFEKALATNLDHGVENRVEQVWDVRVEPLSDRWDGELRHVTARVRWMAIDYTVDLSKLASESGFIIDGSPSIPAECEEVWTFAKAREGAWLLSGIEHEQRA